MSEDALKVFVSGVPYEASVGDVEELFKQNDVNVHKVDAPTFRDSGRLRGYAFVFLKTPQDVQKALALSKKLEMDGRYLTVDAPKSQTPATTTTTTTRRTEPDKNTCTIFMRNLPYDTDEKEVAAAVSKLLPKAALKEIRLAKWHHTGRLKGVGYAEFSKPKDAATFMATAAASSFVVGDRSVVLDFENGRPKKSFKNAEGRLHYKAAKTNKTRAAKK